MIAKRITTALVVLLALVAVVFTGCTGTADAGKVTLKILAYGDNSTAEGKTAQVLIDEFAKANPNLAVESEILYDEAYHQKARARIASNDFPHVMYVWAGPRSNYFYDAGLNVDARGKIDAQFDEAKIQAMGPNGEKWYVPIGVSNVTSVLFANTELLKSLGLSEPATYEDLVAMVPVAKAKGLDVVSFAGAEAWVWNSCLLSPLVGRYTAPTYVADAVRGTNKFDEAGMVQALAMIKKMVDDEVIPASAIRTDYGTSVANFIGEKALFTLDGQWRAGAVEDPAMQAKVKMLPLPVFPGEVVGGGSVSADISTGYAVTKEASKDPKVEAAAWAFVNFFGNEKNTLQRWKDGAIAAPLLMTYAEPTDFNTINMEKLRFYKSLTSYTNVVDAFVPADPNNNLNANIQEMVLGNKTPEEVAAALEADVAKTRK